MLPVHIHLITILNSVVPVPAAVVGVFIELPPPDRPHEGWAGADEIVVVFALQDFGCALGHYGVDDPNEAPPMCYARLRKDDVLH